MYRRLTTCRFAEVNADWVPLSCSNFSEFSGAAGND